MAVRVETAVGAGAERVSAARTLLQEKIDEVLAKIIEVNRDIRILIEEEVIRLNSQLAVAGRKITVLEEKNRLLEEKVKVLEGRVSSVEQVAKLALKKATWHSHRYNPGLDWRVAAPYDVSEGTPQWEI